MARSRSPDSIEAEKLYHSGMSLVDIARKLGKPEGTVRRWKSTQKWDDGNKSERSETNTNARINKANTKEEAIAEDVRQVISNPDLTDKQRLFCLYYVKCFNATKAYQKAYGVDYLTANAHGYEMLSNVVIRKEIQRLKRQTLYLWIIIISLVVNTIFFNLSLIKGYAVIRDYYYDSLDLDRELNQNLDVLLPKIEELQSKLQ